MLSIFSLYNNLSNMSNSIFKRERLWLRVSRLDGNVVVGKVWNHPVKRGLLFGHLIGIPIVDVIDSTYNINKDLFSYVVYPSTRRSNSDAS